MKSNIARLSSNGFPMPVLPRYGLTCTNVKKRLSRVLTVCLSLSSCRLVSLLYLMMFEPVVKYLEETLPLHQAISEGNVAAAKAIVDQAIIDVNSHDRRGYTALHLATSTKEADLRIAVRHGSHTHRAISLSFFLSHTNRSLSLSLSLFVCSSATFCFVQSESTCWLEMTRRILLSTRWFAQRERWRSEEITLMCSRRW